MTSSLPNQILAYIRENPGATRQQIIASLPEETKTTSVSGTLRRLREDGAIEDRADHSGNFGGMPNGASPANWYIVDNGVDERYVSIARTLLEELKEISVPAAREGYLAGRLQDIFT